MGKSIENGVLKQLSPSMINAFDPTTTFGCLRRAWYKYVQGLQEPQTGNQELGEKLHSLIEERLLKGAPPTIEHEAAGLYLAGQNMIEDVAKRKILGVEASLADFRIDDVRTVGYIDVVWEKGIIDWKTSSDIKRYGKTAEDLATDTQMLIYAKAMHGDLPEVHLAHGQFQTKGSKRTNFVEVIVTQEQIDSHFGKVIVPLVRRIKEVAKVEDVSTLPRNDKACFNCAFKSHCPYNEGNTVMSFFKKLNAQSTVAAIANSDKFVEIVKVEEPAAILPPDAPKSDPALAAKPVPDFDPLPPARKARDLIVDVAEEPKTELAPAAFVGEKESDRAATATLDGMKVYSMRDPLKESGPEQAAEIDADTIRDGVDRVTGKRGRGRPPGSKNKPKTVDPVLSDIPRDRVEQVTAAMESVGVVTTEQAKKLLETGDVKYLDAAVNEAYLKKVTVRSVTVSKGVTLNLGSFNSIRFDVSVTAEGSDLELVYATLMGEVEERLNAEAAKYEAEVDQKNKTMKNGADVVK